MEKQSIINAIVALNGTLSAFQITNNEPAQQEVTNKILELVKQL